MTGVAVEKITSHPLKHSSKEPSFNKSALNSYNLSLA